MHTTAGLYPLRDCQEPPFLQVLWEPWGNPCDMCSLGMGWDWAWLRAGHSAGTAGVGSARSRPWEEQDIPQGLGAVPGTCVRPSPCCPPLLGLHSAKGLATHATYFLQGGGCGVEGGYVDGAPLPSCWGAADSQSPAAKLGTIFVNRARFREAVRVS